MDLILELVEDVNQLIEICHDMRKKAEYGLILKVGQQCFLLLDKQAKEAHEKRKDFLSRQHEIKLLKEEQEALSLQRKRLPAEKEKQLKDLEEKQINAAVIPQHDPSHNNSKLQVCRLMIEASLDSKTSPIPEKIMKKEEIDAVIQSCMQTMEDVNHIHQLAELLRNRSEFEYALKMEEKTQDQIKVLEQDLRKREELRQQLSKMKEEQEQLQQQRKQLPADKQDQLNRLELEISFFQLIPNYANQVKMFVLIIAPHTC